MTDSPNSVPRRGFLGRAAATALGLVAAPRLLQASLGPQATQHDRWLDRLTGTHRTLFDMPNWNGGLPMVHILNYMNTYNTAYGVKDGDINVVGTFYGATTLAAANDAMWAKYRLGELLDEKDPSGAHWTRNPWRAVVYAEGLTIPAASTEAIQRRGGLFIACNNALTFFFDMIAKERQATRATVEADIRANLLPGVVVVPAMVIAIEKAQGKGLAYNRQ